MGITVTARSAKPLSGFEGMWVARDPDGVVVAAAPNAIDLETAVEKLGRANDRSLSMRRIPRRKPGKLVI